jgi:hypothetical protein
MLRIKIIIIHLHLYKIFSFIRQTFDWYKRGFAAHSPNLIKHAFLIKNSLPNSIWIETGTYLGETTKILSKYCSKIYSIEPELTLFEANKKYFLNYKNVKIINKTSELGLKEILPKIKGNVNFWLDAHAVSNNKTKTFHGSINNPILNELEIISIYLSKFNKIYIFIDDVNLLNEHEDPERPNLNSVIAWCKKNNLHWSIAHNILLAKKIN